MNKLKQTTVVINDIDRRRYKANQKKEWYEKNKPREAYKRRQKYLQNRDKERKFSREWKRQFRTDILTLLGNKCIKCGVDDWRCLQIDHIEGGGTQEVGRRFGSQYVMYRFYLTNPELAFKRLQLLCANCNQVKKYENHETRPVKYDIMLYVPQESCRS